MKNQELSKIFNHMAEIYELRGKTNDVFRARSYNKAAMVLKELPSDICDIAEKKELESIPGIGKNMAEKITDFLKNGKIKKYEELKKEFPESLLELLEIQSLGPKKLKILRDNFQVNDLNSLKFVLKTGSVADLPGFGAKTIDNIEQGIVFFNERRSRQLLGDVYLLVKKMIQYMKKCPDVDKIETAGSFRRKKETIGDIDLLVTGKNHQKIVQHFIQQEETRKILAQGTTKASVILKSGKQVDLRVVDNDEWGSALQYFTGSKQHNIHLRTIAKEKGIKISEYGAFKKDKKIAGATEESIYQSLGMQYIPPEMREDRGEIELAEKNKIPSLIQLSDIKGDLHLHSTWSDGRNSITEMAQVAEEKGYEYLAITDHSQSLKVAHGLSVGDVKKKQEEIRKLSKKSKVKVLFGTEVDIKADGSIDYPNEVLKKFDYVVASIHSGFKKDNTERILKAMENPYVHTIGHLSGRMIGVRDSYPLDYDAVFKKAAATKTLIEINAQPFRLDVADYYLQKGKGYGVKFIISTDAHSIHTLWFMELGVAMAKRGWLTKEDVLNTMSWDQLEKILK